MRSTALYLSGWACAALLAGCALPVAGDSAWPVEGTHWALRSGTAVAPERAPYLRLHAATQRFSFFGGCNRMAGSYNLAGAALKFGPAAGTRMACTTGADSEAAFVSMMSSVAGWQTVGNRLQLLDAGKVVLAEFESESKRYRCTDGQSALVHYDNTNPRRPQAWLTLGRRDYAMTLAPSASGARYMSEHGREPGMALEWSTKGANGMLREAPSGRSTDEHAWRTTADCTAVP